MEAIPAKGKEKQFAKSNINLDMLEDKVVKLIELVKMVKDENATLKQKNKDLYGQIKALEGSMVLETKNLEELSQEKVVTKMVVDNLLHSIDALIEIKEK